jgi:hypothetical protein
MRMRKLGALEVSELGFGALSFASTYGQARKRPRPGDGILCLTDQAGGDRLRRLRKTHIFSGRAGYGWKVVGD